MEIYLILGFVSLLFLFNRNLFFFNPYGSTPDAWIYPGYFLNFEYLYQTFGILYYGTRLSWIIPGYILYHLFPPIIANYILHFGFVIAAILSIYCILKHTISERISIFTTLLLSGYYFFWRQMGWDYVSGSAMTFFLLSMAFLTISDNEKFRKYHLFFAGVFSISMIYANFFMIIFLPTLLVYTLFIHYKGTWIPTLHIQVHYILGILGGSVLMELFVYALSGKTIVIIKQFLIGIYLGTNNECFEPIETWIFSADWLCLPLIVGIGCIILLLVHLIISQKKNNPYNLFFTLNFLATIAIFIGLYLIGRCSLQLDFYACYLIPPMFLAIGALCSGALNSLTHKHYLIVIFFEFCILLLPYSYLIGVYKSLIEIPGVQGFLLFFTACWIIFFICSALKLKGSISNVYIVIILFAVISMGLFNGLYYNSPMLKKYPGYVEDGFESVVDSVKIIDSVIDGQNVRFWYNISETNNGQYYGGLFANINAAYLWMYTYISQDFPNIDKNKFDIPYYWPNPTPIVVILSTQPDVFQQAQKSLNNIGYNATLISEKQEIRRKIKFNITFIDIKKA